MEIIRDKNKWDSLLNKEFAEYNDIFFNFNYFELYGKHYGVSAEAIFWQDKNLKIFWSHLIRKINQYFDLTTPYGYGGPLVIPKIEDAKEIKRSLKFFFEEYKDYAKKQNYISEFIRFHPVFQNWEFLEGVFDIEYLNDVVLVDLRKSGDEIFRNMNTITKRYIRKNQKEFGEIVISRNPGDEEIKEFLSLYYKTMKKQNALKKYFFSYRFIKDHFKMLDSLLIYCRSRAGETGSSAIFLINSRTLHYYLGSTNYNFKSSPLRFVLWESIKWGQANDFELLHLGGGTGKNDSLFEFKKGFSRLTKPFKIAKIIFNPELYGSLTGQNNKKCSNYFPEYRQNHENSII